MSNTLLTNAYLLQAAPYAKQGLVWCKDVLHSCETKCVCKELAERWNDYSDLPVPESIKHLKSSRATTSSTLKVRIPVRAHISTHFMQLFEKAGNLSPEQKDYGFTCMMCIIIVKLAAIVTVARSRGNLSTQQKDYPEIMHAVQNHRRTCRICYSCSISR